MFGLSQVHVVMGVTGRLPSREPPTTSRSYLSRLLEIAPVGIVTVDDHNHVLESNDQTLRILGIERDDLIGRPLPDLFDAPAPLLDLLAHSLASQTAETAVTLARTSGGETRFVEARAGTLDEEGLEELTLVVLLEVTDRVEVEETRRRTLGQIEFLAEASRKLASSLQVSDTLEILANFTVPYLADWCAVDLVDREGSPRRVVVRHSDATKAEVAAALKRFPPTADRGGPILKVLRSGSPVVIDPVDDEVLDGIAQDEEHRRVITELGAGSALVVPLEARGRMLGSMLLVRIRPGHYDPADLAVAQDLAQRAALSMDNGRLFQEHRHVARKLQQNLLPPSLPDIPGIEVGARYCAAGEGVEVGGDFYDFFRLAGRGWAVVIGDVSGKGPEAAGITALARYTARAAAMQVRSLRRIFTIINEAILQETGAERFASVAFVRLDAVPQPGTKKILVASAGHPLPLVLRATGEVEELGEPGTILGLLEDVDVREQTLQLHPGDLLLLYTDGVTEARNEEDRLLGMAGVKRLLATCAGLAADDAAERLSEVVLEYQGREPRDDLAVVTLRVPPIEDA